jgi:HlyD family secretion protein
MLSKFSHVKRKQIISLLCTALFASCSNNKNHFDASGTFEATEIIVSAEATGQLMQFDVKEGNSLAADAVVGYIDSTQQHLTKLQLLQNKNAILAGRPDIKSQIDATQKQIDNTLLDQQRIANLVKGNVASQKQLDDVNTRLAVLQSQLAAQKSSLGNTTSSLNDQSAAIDVQLAQVSDQLEKCVIENPASGTVLVTYANAGEVTAAGKPLYKIADLLKMELRAYISGDQLSSVKIGQQVKVKYDTEAGNSGETTGTISWISSSAEFTPKIVQTKEERTNLVYAIKISVDNKDGKIKIGMPGEMFLK